MAYGDYNLKLSMENLYKRNIVTFGTRAVDPRMGFDIDEDRRQKLLELLGKAIETIDRCQANFSAGIDRAFGAMKDEYKEERNVEIVEEKGKRSEEITMEGEVTKISEYNVFDEMLDLGELESLNAEEAKVEQPSVIDVVDFTGINYEFHHDFTNSQFKSHKTIGLCLFDSFIPEHHEDHVTNDSKWNKCDLSAPLARIPWKMRKQKEISFPRYVAADLNQKEFNVNWMFDPGIKIVILMEVSFEINICVLTTNKAPTLLEILMDLGLLKYNDRAKEQRESQNLDYEITELASFHIAHPLSVNLLSADIHKLSIDKNKYFEDEVNHTHLFKGLDYALLNEVGTKIAKKFIVWDVLKGSYAESSYSTLVVSSISSFGINHDSTTMIYPRLVNFVGILVCLFTTCCFFIKIVKSRFLCELAEDLSLKSMEGMERCLGNYALLLLVSFLERGKVYRGQNSVVHGSVEMAWEQTHLRCVKLVSSLTQQGFSCGDVIEILVPDIPAMQELHFPMAGTITCTLNMRYDSFMISILLQRCEAKIIFAYQFLHIVQGAFYILAKLNRKSLILVLIPEQDTPSPSSSVSPIMDKYSSVTYAFQLVSATLVVEDENPKIPVKYVRVYVYAPEQFPEEVVFFCAHTLGRSRPDRNEWDKPKTKCTKDGLEPHRGQSWTVQWLNFDNFYIKDAIEEKN